MSRRYRCVDFEDYFLINCAELIFRDSPSRQDTLPECDDWIVVRTGVREFLLRAIRLRVAAIVPVKPNATRLDEAWAVARSGTGDGCLRRFMNCEKIAPINRR